MIINWKDGYVVSLSGESKASFKSVSGDSFTAVNSDSFSFDNGRYESNFILDYTTNFETGELTGTAISKTTDIYDDTTEVCTANITITANVVL